MPIFAVLALAVFASPVSAQETAAESVRAVTVTVVDEKGKPVTGLVPEEIAVVEDGAARTVTRFEPDRRELSLAVIVDSSEPMATHYRLNLVDAVVPFLQKLPAGTKYSVWVTGDRPVKVVDFGDGPATASRALRRVFPTGGNRLLDAIVEANDDLGDREASRSAMVIVTGTGIGFTDRHRQQVVEAVRRGPAVVLAAQIDDSAISAGAGQGEVSRLDYDYVLSRLAETTGGRREILLSPMGVDEVLDEFAAELGAQYRLSYLTSGSERGKGKVEIQLARPGLKARLGAERP